MKVFIEVEPGQVIWTEDGKLWCLWLFEVLKKEKKGVR
jgi:hypothetical protein